MHLSDICANNLLLQAKLSIYPLRTHLSYITLFVYGLLDDLLAKAVAQAVAFRAERPGSYNPRVTGAQSATVKVNVPATTHAH